MLLIMTPISCAGGSQGGIYEGRKSLKTRSPPQKKNIYQPGYSTPHPPLSPSLLAGASGGSRHLPFLLCPQGGVVTTPGPRQGGIEAMAPHLVHCPPPRPPPPRYLSVCSLLTSCGSQGVGSMLGAEGSLHGNGGKRFFQGIIIIIIKKNVSPESLCNSSPPPIIFFFFCFFSCC